MARCVGVIPAGGNGLRWGGYPKEALPISTGRRMIDHAVDACLEGGANRIIVATNQEKSALHLGLLRRREVPICFVQRAPESIDVWGAVLPALPFCGAWNFLAMPDTLFPTAAFRKAEHPFSLGVFSTDSPGRFGIILYDEHGPARIADKDPSLTGIHQAWGLVAWAEEVSWFWQQEASRIERFDQALTKAISAFGLHTFALDEYRDMATFDDYQEWMRDHA